LRKLKQSTRDKESDGFRQHGKDENEMKRREFVTSITAAGILIPLPGVTGELNVAENRKERASANEVLLELDNTWTKAEKEGDLSSVERILDRDFVLIDFDGAMYTKSGYLDTLSKTKFISYSITDQVVHSWGETGLVTGKWRSKWVFDGKEEQGTLRFTAVFSRRGGAWQAVAESVVTLAE
jgi:ketosteroid isomerase-like protein